MVNRIIFLLAIICNEKKMFYLYYSWSYRNVKIVKCFAKVMLFGCAVSLRLLKLEHFFFLQLIANKKNNRGYHIPMIDLGESKKVTAVLKLLYFFKMPGVVWSCLELSFLEIIFTILTT